MRQFLPLLGLLAAVALGWQQLASAPDVSDEAPRVAQAAPADTLATAFRERKSGLPVAGEGMVTKVLADDDDGSRHQRFVLRLANGQTVLVAHNIDLAPRIPALAAGDPVSFRGIYEWNARGGVIHWTHHDPRGSHPEGWLMHGGRTFR